MQDNRDLKEYCPNCKKVVPAVMSINSSRWEIRCSACGMLIDSGEIKD
jgi:hypothetical protein